MSDNLDNKGLQDAGLSEAGAVTPPVAESVASESESAKTSGGGFYAEAEQYVQMYFADRRPDLKDLIIVQYGSLVERTARKFAGSEPLDDLVQVGYIGLLNALSKFDPEAGVRFTTYATHLVAGEIKHYLRDKSQTIRTPAWIQELRARVNKAALDLQVELGRVPTHREIADQLNLSEESVTEIFAIHDIVRVTSLDASVNETDDTESDLDRLDGAQFCPEQLSVEDRVTLEEAMKSLRDLERDVLTLFHFEALTQTEIAARLDISCNYVSHILRQSLTKLRKVLAAQAQAAQQTVAEVETPVVDAATGVYSEAYFKRRMTEEVHRAIGQGGVVSVVRIEFAGLDKLGAFFGPSSIGEFLADAGEMLKGSIRALDILCRSGKYGFGLILPATGPSVAIVEQRLRSRLETWVAGRLGPTAPITVMVGAAVAPDDARDPDTLIEQAAVKAGCRAVVKRESAA